MYIYLEIAQMQKITSVENDIINLDLTNKMKFYTLNINAIDKEYNKIPVAGAEFEVYGYDNNNTQVLYESGTTDSQGNLSIEINKSGEVKYVIKQKKEHAAYENTNDYTYTLNRDFETNELTMVTKDNGIELDNDQKIVTATIPLQPKKFNFKINKKRFR